MKECPNCKKIFADDLFYCLDDGTPLVGFGNDVDSTAPTDVAINVGQAARTEVLPNRGRPTDAELPSPREQSIPRPPSKLPYVAIGALTLACISLAAAMIVINRDRIFPTQETKANATNEPKSTPSPVMSNSSPPGNAAKSVNKVAAQPAATFNPTGKWKGEWTTDSGTLLDIEISLTDSQNNALDGQIRWTMRRTARPDKTDKIGLSATEFVRGSFDPARGVSK